MVRFDSVILEKVIYNIYINKYGWTLEHTYSQTIITVVVQNSLEQLG